MRRSMKLELGGRVLYESHFDLETGILVREVEASEGGRQPYQDLVDKVFSHRWGVIPSPSPELVDVSLTTRCHMGCPYCYMDSKPRGVNASRELVVRLLETLDPCPYQVVLGGGEPTLHPDFEWILETIRSYDVIPSYTTSGSSGWPSRILEATAACCGGVALTYHAWKGLEWFEGRYRRLSRYLEGKQVNVHLIADRGVVQNLNDLIDLQDRVGPLNVVLLAYLPDKGRATMDRMMSRTTYTKRLPEVLGRALVSGMGISFSDGLLPYFRSRPELGVGTEFAVPSEGIFSCYVDVTGRMHPSSFDRRGEYRRGGSLLEGVSAQELWRGLDYFNGNGCYANDCDCGCTEPMWLMLCKRQGHNALPLCPASSGRQGIFDRLLGGSSQ